MSHGSSSLRRMLARVPAPGILLLCLLWAGCVSSEKKPNRPREDRPLPPAGTLIDEINLLAIPVALNFDDVPGADGFVLKIFPGSRQHPQPIPIESGTIEVLMFDGVFRKDASDPVNPRQTWKYTAAELKRFEMVTSIGTGYQIALPWGEAKPTQDRISVIVRYGSPQGANILSAPSVISVTGN